MSSCVSGSVAHFQHYCKSDAVPVAWRGACCQFVQFVNHSFDILNARMCISRKPLAVEYGMDLDCQTKSDGNVWMLWKHSCWQLTALRLMTTINSLFGLPVDMKAINMKHVLTAWLNQDCLENVVSNKKHWPILSNLQPTEIKHQFCLFLFGHYNTCASGHCD